MDTYFSWSIVRLVTGRLVEWHVTRDAMSRFPIIVEDHGFTACDMRDYKRLYGKGKCKLCGVRFTPVNGEHLEELPQKRGVRYYKRQARIIVAKKWQQDAWYALLMAEYHRG